MKLPGRKTWSLGVCKISLGQQSYNVEVYGQTSRKNRRQLRVTSEMAPLGTVGDLMPDEGGPEPISQRQNLLLTFRYHRVLCELAAGNPERYAETRRAMCTS